MEAKKLNQGSRKFKMVIVGEANVGKSNLLERLWNHCFAPSKRATDHYDFAEVWVETEGVLVRFEVWDTAGQERYRGVTDKFYRNAHLCVLVYDVTRRKTFEHVSWWYNEMLSKAPPAATLLPNNKPNIILVGNKTDLEHIREVTPEEGRQLAASWSESVLFCEHSAVLGQELSSFMIQLARASNRTLRFAKREHALGTFAGQMPALTLAGSIDDQTEKRLDGDSCDC